MQTQYEIFVSSKMLELRDEREMLQELIPSLSRGIVTFTGWIYEDDAEASDKSIRDVYLNTLRKCDLYIGLFAGEYGKYTIDEFEHATLWGIDRHIYVKQGVERDPDLQAFLRRIADVETGIAPVYYATVDELRSAVERSINAWFDERSIQRLGSPSAVFARTPNDLLERPQRLIGRDDLLGQINETLDQGQPVLLQGFGGMGKTALAAEVAARRIEAGKGAALWQRVGMDSAEAVFEAIARPFNAHQDIAKLRGDEQLVAVRQLLAERGVRLLILDDMWNRETLFQVMKAVPREVGLLVTSRHRYPNFQRVEVGRLARGASLELLGYHAGESYRNDPAADSLCEKMGDSAYGLRVVGMTIAVEGLPPQTMLEQLEHTQYALRVPMDFADEGQRSLAQLIEVSLNMLVESGQQGKLARAVFLAMGCFFAPQMTSEMLSLYMEEDNLTLETAMNLLTDRGLAEPLPAAENSRAAYQIHDLAYSYARVQNADYQRHKALEACLVYADRYQEPSLPNFAALRPELDNLLGAANWAVLTERSADVVKFAWWLYGGVDQRFLSLQGYLVQSLDLLNAAIQATEKLGARHVQEAFLAGLGAAYEVLGQYPQAIQYYEQALHMARELGNRQNEGSWLGGLGIIYFSRTFACYPLARG
jgi:tetratricopeptide (TPR) repeat protein